jgi:crotonobetainyl-CoA:carnitine CoA-transferase CaiB-like acyl-CoA transferase
VVNFVWVDAAGNQILADAPAGYPSNLGMPNPLRFTDGWGVVTPTGDADFAGMCKALGVDGYHDSRVASVGERYKHRELSQAIYARYHEAAAQMSTEEAMGRLEALRVPCGVVLTTAELADDPHVQAVGLLREGEHPVVGRIRQPRHAISFDGMPVAEPWMAPTLGQHADDLLGEFGLGHRAAHRREVGVVA